MNCTDGCGLILGGTDVLLLLLSGVVVIGGGIDLLWSLIPCWEGTIGCAGEAGCCCG